MTDTGDFDSELPDVHETGDATDDPVDTTPPEGEETDPGELPDELPDAEYD